jgi:hypothetical protein
MPGQALLAFLALMVLLAWPAEALARGRGARMCGTWKHQRHDPVHEAIYQACLLRETGIITTMMSAAVTGSSAGGLGAVASDRKCVRGDCVLVRDLAIGGLAIGGAALVTGVTLIVVGQLRMDEAVRVLRGLPLQPAAAPPGSWGGGLRFEF